MTTISFFKTLQVILKKKKKREASNTQRLFHQCQRSLSNHIIMDFKCKRILFFIQALYLIIILPNEILYRRIIYGSFDCLLQEIIMKNNADHYLSVTSSSNALDYCPNIFLRILLLDKIGESHFHLKVQMSIIQSFYQHFHKLNQAA